MKKRSTRPQRKPAKLLKAADRAMLARDRERRLAERAAAVLAASQPEPPPPHEPVFVLVDRRCALCREDVPPAPPPQNPFAVETHPVHGLLCPACWDQVDHA